MATSLISTTEPRSAPKSSCSRPLNRPPPPSRTGLSDRRVMLGGGASEPARGGSLNRNFTEEAVDAAAQRIGGALHSLRGGQHRIGRVMHIGDCAGNAP